jgi:hypothetical protein
MRRKRNSSGYSSENYWEKRYKDGNIDHEWYFSYDLLSPLISSLFEKTSSHAALEIGCGDRPLLAELNNDFPLWSTHAIDYSQNAIDAAKSRCSRTAFSKMDARKLSFPSDSFDFVIDKGTIDAMMSDDNLATAKRNVTKIIKEVLRVMKFPGSFMLISHVQMDSAEYEVLFEDILFRCLAEYQQCNWRVKAHISNSSSSSKADRVDMCYECNLPSSGGNVISSRAITSVMASEEEENGDETNGTVYVVTSILRPRTRNVSRFPSSIDISVVEYNSSDDE